MRYLAAYNVKTRVADLYLYARGARRPSVPYSTVFQAHTSPSSLSGRMCPNLKGKGKTGVPERGSTFILKMKRSTRRRLGRVLRNPLQWKRPFDRRGKCTYNIEIRHWPAPSYCRATRKDSKSKGPLPRPRQDRGLGKPRMHRLSHCHVSELVTPPCSRSSLKVWLLCDGFAGRDGNARVTCADAAFITNPFLTRHVTTLTYPR